NVFIVMLVIYFFQGMAVSIHLLEAKRIPKPIWVVVFFLVFLQPVLLGIVIGLGVFDIWADFRKLRRQPAGNDEENGA
ncbi:MAG: DUF2232 domain-containing protein, partial [Nitrospinaceae bacterium]|nr:DUF2232 domain-containing protein [Nitrospinaceae bacterium]NIR54557.1 DUF2232 domain-containing protein [Nitrospinaceae bacterium]NIS84976.1 DUF2232 domain-containing protein [Nitrospinaceae bacterium]NIT84075.1 DUF2232 domain-containing protein [Nitrospinaceae bacterium]NIU44059.1 DUF2232 domain-containing protein [Nitrospinaceae bacterium]